MHAHALLGRDGTVVVPAEIGAALGPAPGDHLHLHVDGRRLVLERPDDPVDGLRSLGSELPGSRSLVDELLSERRRAAACD